MNWTSKIVRALAPQFEVANGSWYAADDADKEWSLKSVGEDQIVIRANDSDESGDAHLEVTITVSKPRRVKE